MDIAELEQQFGIPKGLYAKLITKGEASGVNATSPKGAYGRAQLMPGTAADMGVDASDPDQNLYGGAKYLATLLKKYGGDQTKAVEAYNEGPGRVDRGIVYPETAAYVDRVTGANVVPNAGAASSTAPGGLDLGTLTALMNKLQGDTSKDPAYQAVVAAQGRSQAANAAESAALDQESGELKGVRDRAAGIKAPTAPTPPTLPGEGDYRDKALKAVSDKPMDPTRVMGQFLPMLAILGGAFTKGGAIGSLKAASAAMTAAKQNDTDAIARAHQQWMDDTGKLMDQYKLEQDAFQDAISSNGEKRADTLADMSVIAAQYNIPILKAQIAAGDLDGATKTIAARNAALEPMLKLYSDAKQQDMEMQRLAQGDRRLDIDEQRATAMEQKADATERVQQERLDKMGAGDQGKIRGELVKKGTPGEALQGIEQNLNKLEDAAAHPENYISPSGTAIVADTFTRAFNGGNAIRGFQAKMLGDDRALANDIQSILQRADTGGKFTPAEIRSMALAVKRAEPELRGGFQEAAAEALATAQSDGDPNPLDAIPFGLRQYVDPKVLEQYKSGGAPAAEALPTDLPPPTGHPDGTKVKDGSGKVVAVIKDGQWTAP